ncbi:polysaccharide deacetylase family protein [Krasilnikovia sp. MM14-A1259]|uniref:polysaccharide deacetylase family protein n=1 Tax=Krasilnikovia sp. MM14-A1259 TaxID=3373539 RepID=UPI003807CB6F
MSWQTPDEQTPVDGPGVRGALSSAGRGRHRRPESLADPAHLRPTSAPPAADGFAAFATPLDLAERHWTDDAVDQAGRRRSGAAPADRSWADEATDRAERHWTGDPALPAERPWMSTDGSGRRRADTPRAGHRAERQPRAQRRARRTPAAQAGGRHAAPVEARPLAITVRPLPSVRDAVTERLPAALRAAGAVRDWALDSGDKPPVMGSHRAPGTLPIESWLLVGRHRQQVLLASLVAAGLMLVAIPVQQHQNRVDAINAAEHAVATTQHRSAKPASKPARHSGKSGGQNGTTSGSGTPATSQTASGQGTPAPTTSAPAQPAEDAGTDVPAALPHGNGPAHSLRTTGSTAVALTFDDGPDPVQTPKLLDLLAKYHVKATFCLVGTQVQKHPDIVRQIAAAGHTLCNHTWEHSLTIGKAKPAQIQADLERTNEAIRAAVPGAQIPYFRAPGGNFTERLVRVAAGADMTSLYWEVDPTDWDHPAGEDDAAHIDRVVDGVQKAVQPGSIVLSHDFNQPDTIEAYARLLPWLTKNFRLGLPTGPQPEPAETTPPEPTPTQSTPSEPTPSAPPAVAAPDAATDGQPVQP